jgi:sugar-phosphatase
VPSDVDFSGIRAILSDLDGTLIDSTIASERVYHGWMADRGLTPWAEHPHGVTARAAVAMMAPELDPDVEAAELERREVADTDGVVALPGAAELLALGAGRGLEVAIVTSCTAPLAETRLRVAGLRAPAVMVTAERTERPKPNPDPYLLAAELLGLDPRACLVLEDAPAGIASGVAAGMRVVAVRTSHGDPALTGAHLVVDDAAAFVALLGPQ